MGHEFQPNNVNKDSGIQFLKEWPPLSQPQNIFDRRMVQVQQWTTEGRT